MKFALQIIMISLILLAISSGIYQRVYIERKKKDLLGDIPLKRTPPYYEIDMNDVPPSKNGEEFVRIYKKVAYITAAICIGSFVIAVCIGAILNTM